jgi:predicted TIM-barrel fold metal-dependent hydrolase
MIIDSHAYCFEPADSPLGYGSGDEHLRWVQRAMARHHQPAFRLRDRFEGPSEILDPENGENLGCLPDLNFRLDKAAGRVIWDYKGETYTKHFYPPNLRNLEFTPHSLIGEMDYAGVDVALLHTNPMLGRTNEYQAEQVKEYPERILSMALVDERLIHSDLDAVIDGLVTAIKDYELHAIKFNPHGYLVSPEPWDDGPYRPFWEAVMALGVPVFFTLSTGPSRAKEISPDESQRTGYIGELHILMRWMERYPDIRASITHGFPWRVYLDGEGIALPDEIWEPFQNPNLSLEVCFPVRIGDLFSYPYREVWPTLEAMIEHAGPNQLLWGTDMPFQNRFCTYRQSRHWIEKHFGPSVGLSEDDVGLIMGGAAARVLGIER